MRNDDQRPVRSIVEAIEETKTAGTPQYLEHAIANGCTIGPLKTLPEQMFFHVKDFMAQKFGVAILRAEDEGTQEMLNDLFNELTKRSVP